MSLFFDFQTDRYPPGSFQTPVQPPALAPGAEPLVTLCLNQEWIPFILGALNQLTMNTTWSGSDDEIQAARQQANNLILIFQQAARGCPPKGIGSGGAAEEFMLRQNPDNLCELQTSVDGVNWCTWADLSKCTPNSQPAQGTKPTPPGGGCSNYTGECSIGHSWSLPNQVNAGDVITVTNANGLWASPLDLFLSRCPDGNLWFELACVEGTGHTEPGDPAPTINHDSLVAFDGTNYYDCGPASDGMPAVITIAGGVSNANLVFMANTPDTSGTGNVVFDVQYCNNSTASWSHEFNFQTGTDGWVLASIEGPSTFIGQWSPGVGWIASDVDTLDGEHNRGVTIHIASASVHITGAQVYFSYTAGDLDSHTFGVQFLCNQASVCQFSHAPGSQVTGSGQVITTFVDMPTTTDVALEMRTDDSFNPPSGSVTVTKIILSGVGADPYGM